MGPQWTRHALDRACQRFGFLARRKRGALVARLRRSLLAGVVIEARPGGISVVRSTIGRRRYPIEFVVEDRTGRVVTVQRPGW